MKHQILFSLKNNEKIFMNAVCCSRDWHFKGYGMYIKNELVLAKQIFSLKPQKILILSLLFNWEILLYHDLFCTNKSTQQINFKFIYISSL